MNSINSADRSYLPDCWSDNERMNVLFNPFRIREVNPEGWELKMNFWINLINKWCLTERKLVFTIDELRKNFIRNGRLPHLDCIQLVVSHMKRENTIQFKNEIYKNNSTWSTWMFNSLLTRIPLFKNDDSVKDKIINIDSNIPLVNMEILENTSQSIEAYIRKMESPCISYAKFLNILKTEIFAEKSWEDKSLEVILSYLEFKNKLKISEKSGFKIVEIGNPDSENIALAVRDLIREKLENEIKDMEEKLNKLRQQAKNALQNNNKELASLLLKRKKGLDNLILQKYRQLNNIEEMYEKIQEASSQQQIIQANQLANNMFKTLKQDIDNVENVKLELEENINDVTMITSEISKPINDTIEFDEETELNQLLEEIDDDNKNKPQPIDNDLIEKMGNLSVINEESLINDQKEISNKKEKQREPVLVE